MRHVLAALCSLLALPAAYASPDTCAPHGQMVAALTDQYGETRVSAALDMNNFLIEVYANPETGTWTALLTTPDMEACIASAGTAWQDVREAPGVDG